MRRKGLDLRFSGDAGDRLKRYGGWVNPEISRIRSKLGIKVPRFQVQLQVKIGRKETLNPAPFKRFAEVSTNDVR